VAEDITEIEMSDTLRGAAARFGGSGTDDTPISANPRGRRTFLRVLPVLGPLVLLIGTGLYGLDFGLHWDERYYQIGPVRTMVITERPLPEYYGYPSFNYWISAVALLPDLASALLRGDDPKAELLRATESHAYLLRLRALFLVIGALAIVWTYLLVLVWRRSVAPALLAATLLACSWEVAYHLRWVATDSMLMQLGILTVLLAVVALHRPHGQGWLYAAGIAAGLGFGTKYPGGLLILPVLLSGWFLWQRQADPLQVGARLLKLVVVFAGTYLVTTPATLLRPGRVLNDVLYEIRHYASGHAGHTVGRGYEHAVRMLDYFATTVFSAYAWVAVLFGALVAVGAWTVLRGSDRTAWVMLAFPLTYLLYFTTQRAMVVRNLLVVVPFLAILAALGAAHLWRRLDGSVEGSPGTRRTTARLAMATLVGAGLLLNAGWLVYTADTIADRGTDRFELEAVRHVEREPATFFLSPRVRAGFARMGRLEIANVVADAGEADWVLFYAQQAMPRWQAWPANRFRLTQRWFGPHEVNFNVYPNWWGDDRIVVMSSTDARALGPLFLQAAPRASAPRGEPSAAREPYESPGEGLRTRLDANWGLPDTHPCSLLSAAEVALIVGPLADAPRAGGGRASPTAHSGPPSLRRCRAPPGLPTSTAPLVPNGYRAFLICYV
jgi:hypothetical protein